jgi:hypothetical protein
MLVWAEANQGLLSVAALASALILALVEQKRAIAAEQFARDADAAADRRALDASRDADRRAAEASAEADRKAAAASAEADRKATKAIADADRKAEAAARAYADTARREYVDVILVLLMPILSAAAAGRREVERRAQTLNPSRDFNIAPWWEGIPDTVEALRAIMPAAPKSPELILTTQRIVRALERAQSGGGYTIASSHLSIIDMAAGELEKQMKVLRDNRPPDRPMTQPRKRSGSTR